MNKIFALSEKGIHWFYYSLFLITPLIFNTANSELFEVPKIYIIYAVSLLILLLWGTKSILSEKIIFKRTLLDIPIAAFLITQIISSYLSIDPHTSIFGYYSRLNGGLISSICYSFLYFAFVSNMTKSSTLKSIKFLLLSTLIISVWGISEHFGKSPSCFLIKQDFNAVCWIQDVQTRVFATIGQPNWLAAFLTGVLPLCFLVKKSFPIISFNTGKNLILAFLILSAIIFTKSRSALFGLASILIFYIFFKLPNILYLKLGYFVLVIVFGVLLWQYNLSDCFDLNPSGLSSSTPTESCKIRTIVWKGALDIWKNNFLFGTGPETFAYSYYQYRPVEHNLTSEWELLYNKAHNEYLNYLANSGIVGTAGYLYLIVSSILIFISIKSKSYNYLAILSGYISILITNLFGFSISVVNLLFFLYPALWVSLNSVNLVVNLKRFTLKSSLYLSVLLTFTIFFLFKTYNFYFADIDLARAEKFSEQNLYNSAILQIRLALNKNNIEPGYYKELAEYASFLAVAEYSENNIDISRELTTLALNSSNVAINSSPFNLNYLKSNSYVYARLSVIDGSYLNKSIASLEKAILLAPTEPNIYYNLAIFYEQKGEPDRAIELLIKANILKPDWQEVKDELQRLQHSGSKNGKIIQ